MLVIISTEAIARLEKLISISKHLPSVVKNNSKLVMFDKLFASYFFFSPLASLMFTFLMTKGRVQKKKKEKSDIYHFGF